MSELIAFLKGRERKPNVKFAACKEWKDENGNVIEWELKHLTSGELGKIRSKSMKIGSKGKKMEFNTELYNRLMTSASVVYPNLKDASLLDYLLGHLPLDQRTPENAICEILTDDAEYQALIEKVAELNGWDSPEEEEAEDKNILELAKN